ncbi:hypothetical protein D3C76_1698850 [compost metagenome]
MAIRTASQVQAIISASCPSSMKGSQGDSGTIEGRTSMVSGLPSASFMCTWKCFTGPGMSVKVIG